MLRRKLVLSFVVLLASACAPKPAPAPVHDRAADEAAIKEIRSGYAAAFKAGDAARIASYMTSDAHDMENMMETAVGGSAVAASTKAMMEQFSSHEIDINSDKLEISGDLAYDRGKVKTTMMPKGGKTAVVEEGRYLVVLKRQSDNTWKLVELMGNTTKPMVPAPPAKK